LIKIRIDVDYPYPSRLKSFIYTAFNLRLSKDYLKNSKILARMINDSPVEVKAYWFFTTKTLPDAHLLSMLNTQKHEVALHLVNQPFKEKTILEMATNRLIEYYSIHGTAHLIMRILWRRWKNNTPTIPKNFLLTSFHQFPTLSLDVLCHKYGVGEATEKAKKRIANGDILEIHPDWIFHRGTINKRGPYYSSLRTILNTDPELEDLVQSNKMFSKIGRISSEYEQDIVPTETIINKLKERNIDIFTIIERQWIHKFSNVSRNWIKTEDNVALLRLGTYDEWWKKIGKKTRNMVRKAKKIGLINKIVIPNQNFSKGIWKIYNETPIRQKRTFPHYGVTLQTVKRRLLSSKNSIFIGSYNKDELVGFIQLKINKELAIISQILSLQKHWDKAINNSLIDTTIEICSNKDIPWLIYGRMGNHPSLDRFKKNHGFTRFSLIRYYLPLTKKGQLAVKLGLQKEIKDILPQQIKYLLLPIYQRINRFKKN